MKSTVTRVSNINYTHRKIEKFSSLFRFSFKLHRMSILPLLQKAVQVMVCHASRKGHLHCLGSCSRCTRLLVVTGKSLLGKVEFLLQLVENELDGVSVQRLWCSKVVI
jgi:hypothetical protein